jgi:hypothetical protein
LSQTIQPLEKVEPNLSTIQPLEKDEPNSNLFGYIFFSKVFWRNL